jgi:hypothetical protein
MPKVFIISTSYIRGTEGPDFNQLSDFGELVFVLDNSANAIEYSRQASNRVAKVMNDYDNEKDYIVWAGGDPFATLLIGSWLGHQDFDTIKWLRFDRYIDETTGKRYPWKGRYVPVTVKVKEDEKCLT